ncbi:phosphoribosylformylglycinamidine synthase subunit PurS [bacterium]|nr:phosphoribosylformylglycinamidine synthase subunit PurS [bacterium]
MTVIVEIRPKEGILDPQGRAVRNALQTLGYNRIEEVEVGKLIRLELQTDDPAEAKRIAEEAAEKLLYNSNVEQYRILLPGETL